MTMTTPAAKMGGEVVTSTTTTCPSWCTSHLAEDDGTLLAHRGECGFETTDGNEVSVNVLNEIIPSGNAPAATWVDLHAVDCALSPADARRAAAVLLTAADHVDGREPLPWAGLSEWFKVAADQAARVER